MYIYICYIVCISYFILHYNDNVLIIYFSFYNMILYIFNIFEYFILSKEV